MVKNGAFSTLTLSLTIARVVVPSQVDVRARSRVNGFTTAVFFSFFSQSHVIRSLAPCVLHRFRLCVFRKQRTRYNNSTSAAHLCIRITLRNIMKLIF